MSKGALKLLGAACSAASLKSAFDSNARWQRQLESMTPEERAKHLQREATLSQANPGYAAESHSIFDVAYRRSCEQQYEAPEQPEPTIRKTYSISFTRRP